MKLSQAYTKGDRIKMAILLVVAVTAWIVVWREYKKPIDINWQTPPPRAINR